MKYHAKAISREQYRRPPTLSEQSKLRKKQRKNEESINLIFLLSSELQLLMGPNNCTRALLILVSVLEGYPKLISQRPRKTQNILLLHCQQPGSSWVLQITSLLFPDLCHFGKHLFDWVFSTAFLISTSLSYELLSLLLFIGAISQCSEKQKQL